MARPARASTRGTEAPPKQRARRPDRRCRCKALPQSAPARHPAEPLLHALRRFLFQWLPLIQLGPPPRPRPLRARARQGGRGAGLGGPGTPTSADRGRPVPCPWPVDSVCQKLALRRLARKGAPPPPRHSLSCTTSGGPRPRERGWAQRAPRLVTWLVVLAGLAGLAGVRRVPLALS